MRMLCCDAAICIPSIPLQIFKPLMHLSRTVVTGSISWLSCFSGLWGLHASGLFFHLYLRFVKFFGAFYRAVAGKIRTFGAVPRTHTPASGALSSARLGSPRDIILRASKGTPQGPGLVQGPARCACG